MGPMDLAGLVRVFTDVCLRICCRSTVGPLDHVGPFVIAYMPNVSWMSVAGLLRISNQHSTDPQLIRKHNKHNNYVPYTYISSQQKSAGLQIIRTI